jgi:hypothetical protein
MANNPITMKNTFYILNYTMAAVSALLLSSCYSEDPGPVQETEKEFTVTDFDRLEMGDAFHITVTQGSLFEVRASGDRRNIDDLVVENEGSTLIVRYDENRNRRHTTKIDIAMPTIASATFSSASDSRISGFSDSESFSLHLSGASTCQLDLNAAVVDVILSGASYLYMYGEGQTINADISGASVLKAFQYPVKTATIRASGASDGNVRVSDHLDARASGASVIIYRGDPTVDSEESGASTVRQD